MNLLKLIKMRGCVCAAGAGKCFAPWASEGHRDGRLLGGSVGCVGHSVPLSWDHRSRLEPTSMAGRRRDQPRG